MTAAAPSVQDPVRWSAGPVSVPFTVVDLLVAGQEGRARVKGEALRIGASLEVPLLAFEVLEPGLASLADGFMTAARSVWSDRAAGRPPTVPTVLVRVPLVDVRQSDSRDGRSDLVAECRALESTPQTTSLIGLLDAVPSWSDLRRVGSVSRRKDRSTLSAIVEGGVWPLELGGPPCPGEVQREFVLESSHAAWRDRRVRRLVSLRVSAVEVWPDPRPFLSAMV